MNKNKDNSTALADQEAILEAISEDSVLVEIRSSSPLGASLLAMNTIAKQYGQAEQSPQMWAEQELENGIKARKRTWDYSAKTQNRKALEEELIVIKRLFTVPAESDPHYTERYMARARAMDACQAKHGIQ